MESPYEPNRRFVRYDDPSYQPSRRFSRCDSPSAVGPETLETLVDKGRRFLDRLELPEAECAFREVLQRLSVDSVASSGSDLTISLSTSYATGTPKSPVPPYSPGPPFSPLSLLSPGATNSNGRPFSPLFSTGHSSPSGRPASAKPETNRAQDTARLAVAALFGMGEIFSRLSRHVKHSETEWIRRMIHSLLLFRQALDVACSVIDSYAGHGHDPRCTYFQQIAGRSALQAKLIEEGLVNELKNNVLKYCTTVRVDHSKNNRLVMAMKGVAGVDGLPGTLIPEPGTNYPSSKIKSRFDASWLYEVLTQCAKNPILPKKDELELECEQITRDIFDLSSNSSTGGHKEPDSNVESVLVQQTKCKINFDLVQEAIRKLVSEVSSEVRSKYDGTCRRVPRGLMEKRLSSELIMRLSPGSRGNTNLVEAFEEAILFEDESEYFESGSVTDGCSTVGGDLSDSHSVFNDNYTSRESEFYESGSEDESTYETVDIQIFPCATHSSKPVPTILSGNTPSDSDKVTSNSGKDVDYLMVNSGKTTTTIPGKTSLNSATNISSGSKIGARRSGCYDSNGRWLYGIPTVWKSANIAKAKENTNESKYKYLRLNSVEEMSALTERERSKNVLEAAVDNNSIYNSDLGESLYLNEIKLCQTVGHVACKVADSLKNDDLAGEACEMYKYALGVFLDSLPPSDNQVSIIADVIRSIGLIKCSVGDVSAGEQLLDECVDMYDCGPKQIKPISPDTSPSIIQTSSIPEEPNTATMNEENIQSNETIMSPKQRKNMLRASETSFQKGNAICADSYRQDMLLGRVMKLTRQVALDGHLSMTDEVLEEECEDETKDEGEEYLVCIEEAIECYKHAQTLLERVRNAHKSSSPAPNTELYISIISNLADCFVLSGHLEQALPLYERCVSLFGEAVGCPLLPRNAHVLSMMGTINFLLQNFVRAATMYETSHILRQHLQGVPEDPTLEMPWTLCMLSLSYFSMGHYHKCIIWCIRAFTLYVRLYGGRILDVDALGHWFIVQTLYMLGFAYHSLRLDDKALSNLTLCKNLATRSTSSSSDEDVRQASRVMICLADSYCAIDDRENALKYYQQALEYSRNICDDELASTVQAHLQGEREGGSAGTRGFLITALHLEVSACDTPKKDPTEEEEKKVMDQAIKDEMVALLQNLGVSNTLSNDIDHAIGCYSECVQAQGSETASDVESNDIVSTMVNLGTLCQLKAYLKNDNADVQICMQQAERYFDEANAMANRLSPVCVQFANFKYQQGDYYGAILTMLPFVFCPRSSSTEITYHGVEKAVLPEHLHNIADGKETLVLEAGIFAKFLALLAYKQLKMSREIDDVMVEMYKSVLNSSKSLNHVMLGYSLLELGLVEEAGLAFVRATELNTWTTESGEVMRGLDVTSCDSYWMCVLVGIYRKFCRLFEYLQDYINSDLFKHIAVNQKSLNPGRERGQTVGRLQQRVKEIRPTEISFTERLANIKAKNASLSQNDMIDNSNKTYHTEDHYTQRVNTSNIHNPNNSIEQQSQLPNPSSFCPKPAQIIQPVQSVIDQDQPSHSFTSPSASSQRQSENTPNISDRLHVIESRLKSQFGKTLTQINTDPSVVHSNVNPNVSGRTSSGFSRDITISVGARDRPLSELKSSRHENLIGSKENMDVDNTQWTTSEGVVETPREVLELLLKNEQIKKTNSFI